jgi:hypothetical protein
MVKIVAFIFLVAARAAVFIQGNTVYELVKYMP